MGAWIVFGLAVCGALVGGWWLLRGLAHREADAMLMDDEAWRDGEVAAGRDPGAEFDPGAEWKRDARERLDR